MIIYDSNDYNRFLGNKLNVFKSKEVKVIIVDKYYGGDSKNCANIKGFLKLIKDIIPNSEIIWFYDGGAPYLNKKYKDEAGQVEAIDFSEHQIDIHDRFLFIYDLQEEIYVLLLHFGASINAYSLKIKGRQNYSNFNSFGIFRISEIEEINMNNDEDKNNKLLKQLETIYLHETGNEKWGS